MWARDTWQISQSPCFPRQIKVYVWNLTDKHMGRQLTTATVCFKTGLAQSYSIKHQLEHEQNPPTLPAQGFLCILSSDLYKFCLNFLFWWRLPGRSQDLALWHLGGLKYFVEVPLCMSKSNIEMSGGAGVSICWQFWRILDKTLDSKNWSNSFWL